MISTFPFFIFHYFSFGLQSFAVVYHYFKNNIVQRPYVPCILEIFIKRPTKVWNEICELRAGAVHLFFIALPSYFYYD